ncbi:MAG TPA: tRNA 2-thiocytidine(32) synthetase TtcA [Geopsychrobacteraceae bacterium]
MSDQEQQRQRKALFSRITKAAGRAIGDFKLIEAGDRIAVGMSGGKDSYTLLQVLAALQKKAPVGFELIPVTIDSGFAGYQKEVIADYLDRQGFACRIRTTGAAAVIAEKRRAGSSYCAFCARLRRGALYSLADELGCNKLALGHHLDDVIETLLLNQFYGGTLGAMSPKLLADNGRQTLIRPLVYVEESDIVEYSRLCRHPIISCSCPVEGATDQKRQRMKKLVQDLETEIPQLRRSLLGALGNVHPQRLLDRSRQEFWGKRATQQAAGGDHERDELRRFP